MRTVRILWVILFIVPLGFFADRLCYIDVVDPTYHALLWMHERLGYIFAAVALISVGAALARFIRIQGQLRAFDTLRSSPPSDLAKAFAQAASQTGVQNFALFYVDVPLVFCFTVFGGRVIVSQGFVHLIDREDLPLVALHELLHLRCADPAKALLWHLFFAALIVPGFESIEDTFYQRRERRIDRIARCADGPRYNELLKRFGVSICASTPSAAFRSLETAPAKAAVHRLLPTAVPLALLMLLGLSHLFFVQNLPYLQAHHC